MKNEAPPAPASAAARYAYALLGFVEAGASDATAAKAALDSAVVSLERLRAVLAGSPQLRAFLASPLVARVRQEEILAEVCREQELDDSVRRVALLLVRNRRAASLDAVAAAACAELARRRGEVVAQVAVATPLDAPARARLEETLTHACGRTPRLEITQDPSLLAGFVVRLGSRRFDASLRGRLERLRLSLTRVE